MNTHRLLALALVTLPALAGCARTSAALEVPSEDRAVVVLAQAQPAQPAGKDGFTFPADKGGQALGQLLRPSDKLPGLDEVRTAPLTLPPPRELEPGLPLPPTLATLPMPAGPKTVVTRPRTLAEDAPLSNHRNNPVSPALRELETGALTSVQSRNVNEPVPLVILGLQLPDRVPLEDPTVEASVAAVLAQAPPARTEQVPFVPQNLPDPFANGQTVKLRQVPPESPDPFTTTPRPPQPTPTAPAK